MRQRPGFRERLHAGEKLLGTCVTFSDPTVTEALTSSLDFVWIDTEHNPLSLSDVQGHLLATKGTNTFPLVRVPWNDPVLIKPVLDIGAPGIIVPLIRTPEDVRAAVSACKYPPEGIRGFGPRRPSDYGRIGGPEYCRQANDSIVVIVQIEHAEAVENIDAIMATRGLTSVVLGPNDLSGSLGHMGEPRHPNVLRAIDKVIEAGKRANIPVGIATGGEPAVLIEWLEKGISWLAIAADFIFMVRAANQYTEAIHGHFPPKAGGR